MNSQRIPGPRSMPIEFNSMEYKYLIFKSDLNGKSFQRIVRDLVQSAIDDELEKAKKY